MPLSPKRLAASAVFSLSALALTAARADAQAPRVAVFSEPNFPANNISGLVSPKEVAADLRRAGIPTDLLSVDALSDPTQFSAGKYAAVVLPYGNAFPQAAFANLRVFHLAGGDLVTSGIPFTHPIRKNAKGDWEDTGNADAATAYRQLIGETQAVLARASDAPANGAWMKLPAPVQRGFDDDEALLPAEERSFRGYRLLAEYFACPERYLFADIQQPGRAFKQSKTACDIVFLFSRSSPILTGAVDATNFRLFATPAINLFEKQLGRVQVTPYEHQYHVVPDRTRPLDFEVFRLLEVKAFDKDNVNARTVAPLYAFGALLYDWREALFYTSELRPRRLSTREQRLRRRTEYVGTETYISLSAPGDATRMDDIQELAVRALVTNRELPELLRFRGDTHFQISGIPARGVSVLRAPTRPRPPLGIGDAAWRIIGHLTPNYATLAPEDHSDPAALRDHLALYGYQDDAILRRQIDGVLAIQSRKVARRVPGLDRMAIARGHRISIRLDDAAFDRSRMFLFSAVLERFLSEFASINSFTECVFDSPQEGIFAQWPPRIGRRPNI